MNKSTNAKNVYNQLLVLCVLRKSSGFSSGSFSLTKLVKENEPEENPEDFRSTHRTSN